MPKKGKITEFVASVKKPNRDTPIKRQKAKELIKAVKLEESPNQKNFIKYLKSPTPKKKITNDLMKRKNKQINNIITKLPYLYYL